MIKRRVKMFLAVMAVLLGAMALGPSLHWSHPLASIMPVTTTEGCSAADLFPCAW